MDCETDFKAFNSGELNLDEEDELYDDEPTNQSLTPTDSIQNLHHEHHLNHHSAHHCHQHYTSAAHGKPHRPLSPLKQTAYQKTVQTFLNGSSILKQLNTLRLEEANLLREIESLENATIEEDDEELIEFQRIERDIKLAEINKCLALIRNQISKQLAESEQSRNGLPTNTNSRAPLAESEGDTDSQVSSRHNESPSQIASPQPQVQRFIHLSETDDSSGSEDEETEERDDHQRLNMSPSMVHETLLQESIERSLASVGEMRHAFQSMVVNANIVGSVPLTVTNKQLRRGSEYENQDYHQCHSTHLKSLSFVEAPNTEVECFKSEHSTFEEQPQFDENNDDNEDDVESYEMINSQRPESAASGRRFPIDEDSNRVCTPSNVVLRSQNVPATSATSLASNAHRPLTLYLPSANSQLNLITHLHALGHDLTNSTVTNSLLITPFTCSGYLYKQCARPKVGRKKWRKRYFHFNRIRRIFVYFDDRASFEKHQHPKRGVFFDEIQDVYVDHAKSKNHSTSNKTPTSPDENGPTGGNGGRCVFVVSTTELNRKFTLSTFVPELMRIWMDVIFTGANGYLQDYDDYEN